jgi:hypothetical protein
VLAHAAISALTSAGDRASHQLVSIFNGLSVVQPAAFHHVLRQSFVYGPCVTLSQVAGAGTGAGAGAGVTIEASTTAGDGTGVIIEISTTDGAGTGVITDASAGGGDEVPRVGDDEVSTVGDESCDDVMSVILLTAVLVAELAK